jgi:hypothetical protein
MKVEYRHTDTLGVIFSEIYAVEVEPLSRNKGCQRRSYVVEQVFEVRVAMCLADFRANEQE